MGAPLTGRNSSCSPATPTPRLSAFARSASRIMISRCRATSRSPPRRRIASSARTCTARRCIAGRFSRSGPRYCPSIEDKIVKFPDKAHAPAFPGARGIEHARNLRQRHEHFAADRCAAGDLEVDSRARSGAEMMRPGYAIEYDSIDPTELNRTLETKKISGCFWPARSTEPQATKRRRARELWRASTPR